MYPAQFDFHRAASLQEAAQLLQRLGPDAKVLAGGQTLLPMMKLRLLKPAQLIDIGRIAQARGIRSTPTGLEIGALTTHHLVANSAPAREFPILKDCAGGIADPQVRSLGTIAGSLAEADPSSCWPALLVALNADVRCVSPTGERVQSVRTLLQHAYSPSLGEAELIAAVIIPAAALQGGGAFVAFKRAAAAYPTASCALQLQVRNDTLVKAHMALGCVGMTPVVVDIDRHLAGARITPALAEQMGEIAAATAEPMTDNKGSEEYKRSLVRGLVRRAFRIATARAAGQAPVEPTHTYYG